MTSSLHPPLKTDRITLSFIQFHVRHPQVYTLLVEHALALQRAGLERYSINALFEVIRYNAFLKTDDPDSRFKLNNDYRSLYARLIMRTEPRLKGFFITRKRRTKIRA